MKRIVFLLILITRFNFTFSQDESVKNNIYLELLGKGLYYSINYERNIIKIENNIGFNASIGLGLFPGLTSLDKTTDFFLPFELNAQYSIDKHHIVIGYGTTYWRYKVNYIDIDNTNLSQQPLDPTLEKINEWFAHMTFEYRFMKPEGGLMIKAGYTPLFFAKTRNSKFDKKVNYQTSFNLGIGYAF